MTSLKRGLGCALAIALSTSMLLTGCGGDKPNSGKLNDSMTTPAEKVAIVKNEIDYLRKHNGYVRLQDGIDSYITFMFNGNGEAVSQSDVTSLTEGIPEVTMYRNDRKSIMFSDQIYYGENMDMLTIMENALDLVASGNATIEDIDFRAEGYKTTSEVEAEAKQNESSGLEAVDPSTVSGIGSTTESTTGSTSSEIVIQLDQAKEDIPELANNSEVLSQVVAPATTSLKSPMDTKELLSSGLVDTTKANDEKQETNTETTGTNNSNTNSTASTINGDENLTLEDFAKSDKYYYFNLKIKGLDNIKKMYEPMGEEAAEHVLTHMKESAEGKEVTLIYEIACSKSDKDEDRAFGVNSLVQLNDEPEMLNWQFDGYLQLDDWKLDEGWYTDSWDNEDKAVEILEKQMTALKAVVDKYNKENNLLEGLESSASSTVGTEGNKGTESSQSGGDMTGHEGHNH